jgi:hypothetical protein
LVVVLLLKVSIMSDERWPISSLMLSRESRGAEDAAVRDLRRFLKEGQLFKDPWIHFLSLAGD